MEGHALPAPVVQIDLHPGERRRGRVRPHAGLLQVAGHGSAVDHARPVLAQDQLLVQALQVQGAQGAEDLGALVADQFGVEQGRRLHGAQGQEHHHVVLEHVPQDPGLVVEPGAVADAEVLGRGDADMVDVAAVPDGLEKGVGEAQQQDVLHRLLGHVVVDAEDLALPEIAVQDIVQFAGRGQVAAEGLFHDDAHAPVLVLAGQAGLADGRGQGDVGRGRHRVVEEAVLAAAVQLVQGQGEEAGRGGVLGVHAQVAHPGGEIRQARGGNGPGQPVAEQVPVLLRVHFRAAHGQDARVVAQELVTAQGGQGGVDLAHGQIPGGAEDDQADGVGLGLHGTGKLICHGAPLGMNVRVRSRQK